MSFHRKKCSLLLFLVVSLAAAHAQYELPTEIFTRTLLVRSGKVTATAFEFEQNGRLYLVTTRQLGKDLPPKNAVIQVLHGSWVDFPTLRTLLPADQDVDLAILETDHPLTVPYKVVKSSEVLTTGQKVWFMGWSALPPGLPKILMRSDVPFVSIGVIVGIDPTKPDAFTIASERMCSGPLASGPIVYWSPVHKDFEVLGVLKRVAPSGSLGGENKAAQEHAKLNMGLGYSVDLIVDTINGGHDSAH